MFTILKDSKLKHYLLYFYNYLSIFHLFLSSVNNIYNLDQNHTDSSKDNPCNRSTKGQSWSTWVFEGSDNPLGPVRGSSTQIKHALTEYHKHTQTIVTVQGKASTLFYLVYPQSIQQGKETLKNLTGRREFIRVVHLLEKACIYI